MGDQMKVCITGGSGFLGRWVLNLAPDDIDFIVLSRSINKSKFDVIKTDYSYDDLSSIFEKQRFDAVIHLAGRKIDKKYELIDYLKINTILTDRILKACIEFSVENVVTASSRMVYSGCDTLPCKEDEPAIPVNYYGLSKLAADKLGQYYSNKHNINCKSLRFAQIFGIDVRNNKIHTSLFRNFINQARNNNSQPVHRKGKSKKEYIYVKDAANAILMSLENPQKKGIFNIGLGENKTVLELAILINKIFENEGNGYRFLYDRYVKKEENLLDISKSERMLGFSPEWTIKKALLDMKELIDDDFEGLEG